MEPVETEKRRQGRAVEYDLQQTLRSPSLALTRGRKDRNNPYLYNIINILEGGMEGLLFKTAENNIF